MSRSRSRVLAGAVLAVGVAAALILAPTPRDEASAVSRGGRGLLLARRYLEARGSRSTLLEGPLRRPLALDGTVVLAFPASVERTRAEQLCLVRWVRHGGTLLVLYGNGSSAERDVLGLFHVKLESIPPPETLDPVRWWEASRRPWKLEGLGLRDPVWISRPRVAPKPRPDDTVLVEETGGERVFGLARSFGRGLVVVLPSEALANQRLTRGGNADLLELLRSRLDGPFHFDEVLHGLGAPLPAPREGTPMADAILAQLVLLYLLGVVALGRRMGPPWPRERPAGGAVSGLLLRLGAVHRRMGHHVEAARAMVKRAAELHGWDEIPEDLKRAARSARGRRLVALGARVAELQAVSRRRR